MRIKAHITQYTLWFELDILSFKKVLELDKAQSYSNTLGDRLAKMSAMEKGGYHDVDYDPHFGSGIQVIVDVSEAMSKREGERYLADAIKDIEKAIKDYLA